MFLHLEEIAGGRVSCRVRAKWRAASGSAISWRRCRPLHTPPRTGLRCVSTLTSPAARAAPMPSPGRSPEYEDVLMCMWPYIRAQVMQQAGYKGSGMVGGFVLLTSVRSPTTLGAYARALFPTRPPRARMPDACACACACVCLRARPRLHFRCAQSGGVAQAESGEERRVALLCLAPAGCACPRTHSGAHGHLHDEGGVREAKAATETETEIERGTEGGTHTHADRESAHARATERQKGRER